MTMERQADLLQQANQLYAEFVLPLEKEHRGEYVAVSPEGKLVLGSDLLTLADDAVEQLGQGTFTFKIGEQAIGKWR